VKHWPIYIIFGTLHRKKIGVNDNSFAHLTLILLLHYLVKSRSRSLAVYNNEFMLGIACVGSGNYCESTKSLKIVSRYLFNINRIHFEIVLPDIQGGPKNGATLHFPKYLENY